LPYTLHCFTSVSYFLDLSYMGYCVLQNEVLDVEETGDGPDDIRVIGRWWTLRELLISKVLFKWI